MKKTLISLVLCLAVTGFVTIAPAQQTHPTAQRTQPPSDVRKQTTLGKYATAFEAYLTFRTSGDKIYFLDVRTPEEYVYVGHATFAPNIPSMVWSGKFNPATKEYELAENPAFENAVKSRFKPEDTIMVMSRSGDRSAAAVNRLAKVGFKNAVNIIDGFEGDKVTDQESYSKGKRVKNGWKNANLPWTYDLDPNLVYAPAEK
ncbi:MAG: rhodanese-like domain-containing protein [Syntrophobacteraceae bacterium]